MGGSGPGDELVRVAEAPVDQFTTSLPGGLTAEGE